MLQAPFSPDPQPSDETARFLPWTGEFRDPAQERPYLESRAEILRWQLRIFGLLATAAFLLLAGRDFLTYGWQPAFIHSLIIRTVAVSAGVVFQLVLGRVATAPGLQRTAAIAMLVLSGLALLIWQVTPPPGITAASLAAATLLAYYLLVPARAVALIANAAILTVGTAIVLLPRIEAVEAFYAATLLLIANLIGIFAMRRLKRQRRSNHLLRREAGQATAALSIMRQETNRRSEYQAWALDALQVGVVLIDPDHRVHTINRRALELLAVPPEVFKPGDHYEALLRVLIERRDFRDLGLEGVRHQIDRLMRGETDTAAIRFGSTDKVLEFSLGLLPDGSYAIAIADASERYALHRRLRHSVEVAGDGFALYDANDRIAVCSSRFSALYGLTVEQTIGMSYDELLVRAHERGVFDPNDDGPGSTTIAGMTRRRIPERMIEIRTMAGEWFLVHERITPSGDLVVVRTNITARRRMEDELRRAKEEAEKALAELRDAQANLVLAEKMASLGSLVAGMSHEISTPLGIGVSAASHLADEVAKLADRFHQSELKRSSMEDFLDTATEATRIMEGNLARAARLIQAFKQISADQSTDEVRSFRIAEYLHEIMLSLAPALRKMRHRVEIDCPEELEIRNRPGAFGQIVTNLVMNAVQHAFEGREEPGLIRIEVSEPRPGRIVITFSDNGHGIAEEFLPKVFDPFFTTKRGAGGTGLGLHIVYNLVSQVLGGAIAVSSREWEGTRFTLSFPADARPE